MCGLVGAAGNLFVQHEKVVRTMLVLDSTRGEDSTGVATISKFQGAEVKLAKAVGDPFQLFDQKSWDAAFRGSSRAIIGHNRYATMGGISRATAHPFENPTLVGAHNGTLRNKHVLAHSHNYKVDSENLFHHIHEKGIDDALAIMDGAWALVWWNKEEETLNFLRNNERPLYFCRSATDKGVPTEDVIFWASEPWILSAALNRHGVNYTEIMSMSADKLHTIEIGLQGKMSKPFTRDAKGTYVPPPVKTHSVYVPANQSSTSNVIVLKKEEPTVVTGKKPEESNAGNFDKHYLNQKAVVLELMQEGRDEDGMNFISCFDKKHPYKDVRMYPRKEDKQIWEHVGEEIQADINGFRMSSVAPGKVIYKVSPDNYKVLVPTVPTVKGALGQDLTETMFKFLYSECAGCGISLTFGDANEYSLAGECYCPSCVKSEAILSENRF